MHVIQAPDGSAFLLTFFQLAVQLLVLLLQGLVALCFEISLEGGREGGRRGSKERRGEGGCIVQTDQLCFRNSCQKYKPFIERECVSLQNYLQYNTRRNRIGPDIPVYNHNRGLPAVAKVTTHRFPFRIGIGFLEKYLDQSLYFLVRERAGSYDVRDTIGREYILPT